MTTETQTANSENLPQKTIQRVFRGREFWVETIEEWKQSGLSPLDFCKARGLSPNTLNGWQKRLNSTHKQERKLKSKNFLPVNVVPGNSGRSPVIEVQLRNGVVVRFREEIADETLARILETINDAA